MRRARFMLARVLKTRAAWLASVALAALTASFALWDPLDAYERAHVSRTTHQTMESVRADLRSDMQSRLFAQIRVAELWGDATAFSQKEREISCRLFLDHHPGYIALEWLDPAYHVLWAIARQGEPKPGADGPGTEQAVRDLRISAAPRQVEPATLTARFPLSAGRPGLRIVASVVRHDAIVGFLVATVDVEEVFDSMVDDHKELGYSMSVSEGSSEIYRMPGSLGAHEAALAERGALVLPGTTWTVHVWPKPEILAGMRSPLPRIAMALGGLLGSVLMLAVHFGRAARRTSGELRRTHDELEQRVRERTLELERVNKALQAEVADRTRAEDSYRDLSARLLRLQDEERRRIARELHDSTAQMLGALAINIDRARLLTGRDDSTLLEEVLRESSEFVDNVTQEVRTVSYLLHPPMLDDLGLEYVLPWYATGFGRRSGIITTLDVQPGLGRFRPEIELTLFRIVQEALVNVHRHSGSPSVLIALFRSNDSVMLEIRDEGTGLPAVVLDEANGGTPATAPIGVGIAGMRERVRQLHGGIEIESDKGGTTIRAALPLDQERSRAAGACCGPDCRCPNCGNLTPAN